MVKLIRKSSRTHPYWRKAQKKCGVESGDVDPMTDFRFEKRLEKGMTPKQIENFAIQYYKKMGMCKKRK